MVRKLCMMIGISVILTLFCSDVLAIDFGVHPDHTYYIIGSYSSGDHDFYYGSAENRATGDFNGLVIMKHRDNDTMYRTIMIDEGYSENVVFVGFFEDGSFGVVVTKYIFNYTTLEFDLFSTEILKYDVYGNYVDRIIFNQKYSAYNNHGYFMILSKDTTYQNDIILNSQLEVVELDPLVEAVGNFTYQFQGKCQINGEISDKIDLSVPGYYDIVIEKFRYSYQFNLTLKSDIDGIENDGIYLGNTIVRSNGSLYLNNELYVSDTMITDVGYHTLRVEGVGEYVEEYHFVIEPVITGVIHQGEYTSSVYINVPNSILYLNNILYENNTLIARPGRYELTILGVNEYRRTVDFTIYPSVVNLVNNHVYDENYRLNFIGEGRLNGQIIETGLELEGGVYHFELWFEDLLFAQYDFEVLSKVDEDTHETIKIPFLEIALGIFSLVGLFLVFRKK